MDGWGHGKKDHTNAIHKANTPFVDSLYLNYPNAELITHGSAVGLPNDQMGNSEVGHMNIGAGRVVFQELAKINNAIENKSFHQNEVLVESLKKGTAESKNVHLIGLVSDGGVHSHINHFKAISDVAKTVGVKNLFVHAFTDGRDTDPQSGINFINELENHLSTYEYAIASTVGRYYAMDRDNRWERIKVAYDLLVNGVGQATTNIQEAIQRSYNNDVTDEFIKPIIKIDTAGNPLAVIRPGDVVICVNFRTDRCREITKALTQQDFPEYDMKRLSIQYVTMTNYDSSFKDIPNIFKDEDLKMTLGETLEKYGKTQIRIAETEKYPHVTFFFSGGREKPFHGEQRIMLDSPKVATYDLQPEMSALGVKDAILKTINDGKIDFICANFANADMVGHTGKFDAIIKAVETVDRCVKEVIEQALNNNYTVLLTADHGNADLAINEDGSPNTAHSKNLVPLFLISNSRADKIKNGKLGDLAPTILQLMGVSIPQEMNGEILIH